jgi:predicted permease
VNHVGPAFFETSGIPIERGRDIVAADRPGAPDVVIVNQAFARRFWPGQDPIGQRIRMPRSGTREFTVVGVARDVRFVSLTTDALPYVWVASLQFGRPATFLVRTNGNPHALVPAIQAAVRESAPGWTVGAARTMEDRIGAAVFAARMAGTTIGLFATLAVLLAAIGLYGVIAYAVTQRSREVGIRVALGARPYRVLVLFVRQALPVVAIGTAIGLAGAWAATGVLSSLLIGVHATDALTFALAASVLAGTALVATLLPARRATRVDPMIALRNE